MHDVRARADADFRGVVRAVHRGVVHVTGAALPEETVGEIKVESLAAVNGDPAGGAGGEGDVAFVEPGAVLLVPRIGFPARLEGIADDVAADSTAEVKGDRRFGNDEVIAVAQQDGRVRFADPADKVSLGVVTAGLPRAQHEFDAGFVIVVFAKISARGKAADQFCAVVVVAGIGATKNQATEVILAEIERRGAGIRGRREAKGEECE